jgi:hypothetical protein
MTNAPNLDTIHLDFLEKQAIEKAIRFRIQHMYNEEYEYRQEFYKNLSKFSKNYFSIDTDGGSRFFGLVNIQQDLKRQLFVIAERLVGIGKKVRELKNEKDNLLSVMGKLYGPNPYREFPKQFLIYKSTDDMLEQHVKQLNIIGRNISVDRYRSMLTEYRYWG